MTVQEFYDDVCPARLEEYTMCTIKTYFGRRCIEDFASTMNELLSYSAKVKAKDVFDVCMLIADKAFNTKERKIEVINVLMDPDLEITSHAFQPICNYFEEAMENLANS